MVSLSFPVLAITALISSSATAQETACGANEAKFPCGRHCEMRCNAPVQPHCEGINCAAPSSCRCKDGFARDSETNQCITVEECPANECGIGEIKAFCGTQCEGTCNNPFEPEMCQLIRCGTKECRCDLDGGFVRNASGRCVHVAECVTFH